MIARILTGLAVLVSLCSSSYAHGTGYRQSSMNSIALEFSYSTGEAMSYREAKVFSPNDEKFAYQSGRTDEFGRFSFIPNVKGEWRVTVRDEEGHQCEARINITDEFISGTETASSTSNGIFTGTELIMRSILGVSIIMNIALIIRRKHAHQ